MKRLLFLLALLAIPTGVAYSFSPETGPFSLPGGGSIRKWVGSDTIVLMKTIPGKEEIQVTHPTSGLDRYTGDIINLQTEERKPLGYSDGKDMFNKLNDEFNKAKDRAFAAPGSESEAPGI